MAKEKQVQIKGMESLKIKDLDQAMEEYVEARDNRMELTKLEVGARKKVVRIMDERKIKAYRNSDGDMIAKIEAVDEKLKVKRVDSDESGGED